MTYLRKLKSNRTKLENGEYYLAYHKYGNISKYMSIFKYSYNTVYYEYSKLYLNYHDNKLYTTPDSEIEFDKDDEIFKISYDEFLNHIILEVL